MAVTGTTFSAKGGTGNTTELRALGAQVSAAIASAGMVKTTDTGQVDWATVTWITSTQTWGYEIWRFNDALQATKPIFVKLVYTQPANPIMLQITAQVGTATDGAGNLTSAPNTNTSVTTTNDICKAGTSASITAVKPWYIYGDGSSLVIACYPEGITGSTGGYGGLFILERARHVDGTPLGDGVAILWIAATGSGTATAQSLNHHNLTPQLGAITGGQGALVAAAYIMPASGVFGTNMYVLPYFTGTTPRLGAPSLMVVGTIKADMATGNVFTLTHYGASATFVAVSPTGAYPLGMNATPVNIGLGIRIA